MKTNKPVSTISYNSFDFLKCTLDELVKKRVLDFYAFVYHFAESDEEGKNHYHLYMEPNGQIDTDQLREQFKEFDPSNPTKPLGTIKVDRTLHFADWYLYSSHNTDYLMTKFQTRQYHYQDTDFVVSDKMEFLELKHHIDFGKYTKQKDLLSKIKSQDDLVQMVASGIVPIDKMKSYYDFLNALDELTYRNSKPNHNPPNIVPEREIDLLFNDDGTITDTKTGEIKNDKHL